MDWLNLSISDALKNATAQIPHIITMWTNLTDLEYGVNEFMKRLGKHLHQVKESLRVFMWEFFGYG